MNVLVVGAGGAGGYFAGRWAQAGIDVTVVARGRQLEAIRTSGLTLRTPTDDVTVPVPAVVDARGIVGVDLVLFATKSWQLKEAVDLVAADLPPDVMVLGLQNGVGSTDTLARTFGSEAVLGGTCRIISYVEEPGVIRHVGIEPTIVFGEVGGGPSKRTADVHTALDLGPQARVTASDDIQLDIWRKFVFFAPASGVGSVTRCPIGVFRSLPGSRRLLESAVLEVLAVARAKGIPLTDEDATRTLAFVDDLPEAGTTSLHRDIVAGRRSELDALAGAVSRMGNEVGIGTPVHDFMYSALFPLEARARGEVAWEDAAE